MSVKLVGSKQEKVFVCPDDFLNEMFEEPDENGNNIRIKQEYIADLLENRYTRIVMGDIASDSLSQSYITYEDENITIVIVVNSGVTTIYEIVINTNTCLGKMITYFGSTPFLYEYFIRGNIENVER